MKQSAKDIKKEFFKSKEPGGENTPIIFRNGKIIVPTSKGYKNYKRGG